MPVATPWTSRATTRVASLSASTNTAIAAISRTRATSSTGRRPRWSDSAPTVSSAASRDTTYAAKMTVSTTGGKPHRSWYSGYSGLGALEAAMTTTSTDACTQNAAFADSTGRRRGAAPERRNMQGLSRRDW
nr:hypothetical protein [Kocuria sp. UCD-OTCP]